MLNSRAKPVNGDKFIDEDLTNIEHLSLKVLGLKLPISVEEIKKKYKKLVKLYHPDVNADVCLVL